MHICIDSSCEPEYDKTRSARTIQIYFRARCGALHLAERANKATPIRVRRAGLTPPRQTWWANVPARQWVVASTVRSGG
jgi:hypothetical protein